MISNLIFDFHKHDLKPVHNKLLAGLKSPYLKISENNIIGKSLHRDVIFICDYEGKIHFQHSDYPCFDESKKENNKSILDFIHPEDVFLAIENLVYLLQENDVSVVLEARFLCDNKKYYYTKWHVGYFRGMFYFFPLDVPVSKNTSENIKATATKNLANEHAIFWKKELAKTLSAWDETVLHQLKSCTHFQS